MLYCVADLDHDTFSYLRGYISKGGKEISHGFVCAQRSDRQHEPKKSLEIKKQRGKAQMDTFPCGGYLRINIPDTCGYADIVLEHKAKHIPYCRIDVPDDVHAIIRMNRSKRVSQVSKFLSAQSQITKVPS